MFDIEEELPQIFDIEVTGQPQERRKVGDRVLDEDAIRSC
jgi:hypothetical protein